jgi:hypothetical protein
VGKGPRGSMMREDDTDDIEDEDECVLSKLGDGKGRRRRLGSAVGSISIKGFHVVGGGGSVS